MPQLLKEPGFMKRAVPLSVKNWHRMIAEGMVPKRAELIRGVIIEKMSKSILHVEVLGRLFRMLSALLGAQLWLRQEAPLTLSESEPEPDISVVGGKFSDYYPEHPKTALLAIEISVTTLAEDREMAEIYAEAGVQEYWLVNVPARCVEVRRRPNGSTYDECETIGQEGQLLCQSLPGVAICLAELFAGLPPATPAA